MVWCLWLKQMNVSCSVWDQPGTDLGAAMAVLAVLVEMDAFPVKEELEEPLLQCLPEQTEHGAAFCCGSMQTSELRLYREILCNHLAGVGGILLLERLCIMEWNKHV